MAEVWLPGILCIICCPLGNGLLPHTLHPALPPQATWRSGDGCPWTKREKRKIYGWRHTPACLQRMVEASTGRSWETEGEGMVLQVSPLVQAFLTATGRSVSPSSVRECWPSKNDIVPRQPMNIVQAHITHCLDKVAMQSPSTIAWDMFTWPESNKSFWKEDCLPYSPGSRWILALECWGCI